MLIDPDIKQVQWTDAGVFAPSLIRMFFQGKTAKDGRLLIYQEHSLMLPQWSGIHVLQMLENPLLSVLPLNALPHSGVVQHLFQVHHNFTVLLGGNFFYFKSIPRRSTDLLTFSLVNNSVWGTDVLLAFYHSISLWR